MLGLRFCARAFSSCGEWGPLFIAVCGPLTVVASLVAEHRLQTRRLSSCGSRAQLLRGMWHLPKPGLEPVSPASAGRFSTTAPPGKPEDITFLRFVSLLTIDLWSDYYTKGTSGFQKYTTQSLTLRSSQTCGRDSQLGKETQSVDLFVEGEDVMWGLRFAKHIAHPHFVM